MIGSSSMPSTPVIKRRTRGRNLNVTIPSAKAKVDKLVNITQEKIKYLSETQITIENGLRTKVLLESALKKLTNNEVSVHSSPPCSRRVTNPLAINIPPSSPRKRSINEFLYGSRPSSPPSPASSPIPGQSRSCHQSPMICSSPEPDSGDESTSITLSDSIKRMKLINNQQHFIEGGDLNYPNAQNCSDVSKTSALCDMMVETS